MGCASSHYLAYPVFIQVYGTISACTTVFAVPCYSGMSSEMRCACSSVCHAEQLVRRMQDGLCLRAVVAYRSECPALCWGCRVAVLEATNLAATVLPTNANTDHTFTFRATLTLDSTMVVGDQPITFSFGDTASAVVTTNANGLAVATTSAHAPQPAEGSCYDMRAFGAANAWQLIDRYGTYA